MNRVNHVHKAAITGLLKKSQVTDYYLCCDSGPMNR